jgi:hypothetical protein
VARRSEAAADTDAADAGDPEALRLATAAAILAAAAPDDGDSGGEEAAALEAVSGPSLLDELHVLDADSLSLAISILRQRDADGPVQLSERLRDLLLLLRSRPQQQQRQDATGAAAMASLSDANFWSPPDEWADVRTALMGIGINASLDEDDEDAAEEDVWTVEAGGLRTRRCVVCVGGKVVERGRRCSGRAVPHTHARCACCSPVPVLCCVSRTQLLRSLPKLDGDTAQQLAGFLTDLQQRHSQQQPAAPAAPEQQREQPAVAVSKEQEMWWQRAELAYSLLKQQAQQQQQQESEPAADDQQTT